MSSATLKTSSTPKSTSNVNTNSMPSGGLANIEFDIGDLDQLGPLIRTLVRAGKEETYLEQLSTYVQVQESEIERLCNYHYQEFIQSVDQLLKVRVETMALKSKIAEISKSFHNTAKNTVDKKKKLIQRRKIFSNLENSIEAVNSCLFVLDLAQRANQLFKLKKYFASLRCIDDIRSKLNTIQQFDFALHLNDCLPKMQAAVRIAVSNELREWFVEVRENSRTVGKIAIEKMMDRYRQCANNQPSYFLHLDLMKDDSLYDVLDNEEIHFDFKPLYQAIHIFTLMNKYSDLVNDFEEQRRLQANIFLNPTFKLVPSEATAFESYLQDVTGFFVIESMIFGTTTQFRSRASVDILWEQTVNNISRLIQDCIEENMDPELYISINNFIFGFAQTLQAYGFSLLRIFELLSIVFEKYSDLLKIKCSENLLTVLEESTFESAIAKDEQEYNHLLEVFQFRDPSNMKANKPFPRTLPFTVLIPLCYNNIMNLIDGFYRFTTDFSTLNSFQDAQDMLKKSIDNVLVRYLHQPLMSKVDSSESLKEVLQILTDIGYYISICEAFEQKLTKKRGLQTSRVVLQMTQIFRDSHKHIEERIFKLLKSKITEFLNTSDYDFMPPSSTTNKMPSLFLRDLVNFLTTVMYSALENMTDDIKSIIYFEIFDHLSSGILNLILSPSVRRINMSFVEQFATDVKFLERFISGLNDPNIKEAFLELQQTVNLMSTDNPLEYLDPAIFNKRYNRLKPEIVLELFEKLSNAAGLFAHKVDKGKRKAYDTIIVTLKKKLGDSGDKKTV